MDGACSTYILVRKPEGKRTLGICRPRREYNIKMDFRESGWQYVDWMHMDQDRENRRALLKTVINLRFP
jgi:hypothetical protein